MDTGETSHFDFMIRPDMLDTRPVSEKRQALTERIPGVSSESISLRRSSRYVPSILSIREIAGYRTILEQFCITKPEDSPAMLDHMLENSEAFYQSLEIPYRVVGIVSSALNNAASLKYDLEAWFPARGQYKELVSASNCTDYR
jgi:hypothetical protein